MITVDKSKIDLFTPKRIHSNIAGIAKDLDNVFSLIFKFPTDFCLR